MCSRPTRLNGSRGAELACASANNREKLGELLKKVASGRAVFNSGERDVRTRKHRHM